MRRRDFIAGLGGAALVWPTAAYPQQKPMPVICYLSGAPAASFVPFLAAYQEGLSVNLNTAKTLGELERRPKQSG